MKLAPKPAPWSSVAACRRKTIATINEQELTTWPGGGRPYMYGGWWWQDVQNSFGEKVIGTWNQNFSRRLPFY